MAQFPGRDPLEEQNSRMGTGLGSALQNLAQNKLQRFQQAESGRKYALMGLPPELSQMPEFAQKAILQQYLESPAQQGGGYGGQPQGGQMQGQSPYAQGSYGGQTGQQQGQQQGPRNFIDSIRGPGAKQQEAMAQKRQQYINAANSKWLTGQSKAHEVADRSKNVLEQMRDLVTSGKVSSGAVGRFKPGFLQNTETQLFDKLSNELAGLLTQQYGVPTNAKIKFAMSQKPNLEQNSKTQLQLIDRLMKETQKPLELNEIKDRILQESGYEQPANLEQLVNQEYKLSKKFPSGREEQSQQPEREQGQAGIPEDENLIGYLTRQGVRGAARVGGAALGSLGDIASAGFGAANYLTGGATPTYSDIQAKLPISAPTSQNIADKLGELTNGYTNPQSSTDQVLDDVMGTFGSIFAPAKLAGGLAKGLTKAGLSATGAAKAGKVLMPFSGVQVPWQKAIKMAAAGEGAAKAVDLFDGGPVPQTIAKIAAMTAASAGGPRKVLTNLEGKLWDELGQDFSSQKEGVKHTVGQVTKLRNEFQREGVPHPELWHELLDETELALKSSAKKQKINEITNKAAGKSRTREFTSYDMPVSDLIELRKNLNARYKWADHPRIEGSKEYLPKELRKPLGRIIDVIKQPLERASKLNPEAGAKYAQVNDISRGLRTTGDMTDWLEKIGKMPDTITSKLTVSMYKMLAGTLAKPFLAMSKINDLFKAYPASRKIYLDVAKAAAMENKAAFSQGMAKLDRIAKEYEKKS